jgi:phospholipid transport system substrate-binding protein
VSSTGLFQRGFLIKTALIAGCFAFGIWANSAHALSLTSLERSKASNGSGILERVAVSGEAGAQAGGTPLESGARSFIDTMAGRAITFLGNEKMPMDKKKAQFNQLLQESFDMDTIGRFTLGRYWRVSTKQQRDEYMRLFKTMVLNVYSNRFSDYTGQRFDVRGARQDGDKDAVVTSFIIPASGPEIQVDWRVRRKNGAYKIIDVIVEGVSMCVTQRSDFSAVIQRGGGDVQVLLAYLKEK